jgi:hypothetical protein
MDVPCQRAGYRGGDVFRPRVLAYFVLALVILGATFLLFSRSLTGQDYLKDFFLLQLEDSIGRRIDVDRIKLVLFPSIRLDLSDVVIHDRDPTQILLTAKRVDIVLRLFPLLRKEVVGKRLLIDRPQLHLRRYPNGTWNLFGDAAGPSPEATLQRIRQTLRIKEAKILNGTLTILDEARPDGPRTLRLEHVETLLAIRPERVRADLRASATLPAGDRTSAVSLTGVITRGETKSPFAGDEPGEGGKTFQFEGATEAANLPIRDLADFLGPRPVPEGVGGFANLRGRLRFTPGVAGYDAVLTDIAANVDRVALTGQANISGLLTAQPTFSVTFSTAPAALSELLAHVPPHWIHPQLTTIIADRQIAGTVEAVSVTLTGSTAANPQLSLTGEFKVLNAQALLGDDRVLTQNLSATAFVEAGRIRIQNISGIYGPIRISDGKAMVSFLEAGPWLEMEVSGDMTAAELFRFLARTVAAGRLARFLADARSVEGAAQPTFRLVGPLNQPGGVTFVSGEITARNISFTSASLPERISALHGRLLFSQAGTKLDQVSGYLGTAQFQLQGIITGGPTSVFQDFLAHVKGDASEVRRFLPEGTLASETVQGSVSSTVAVSGPTNSPHLRGDVLLTDSRVVIAGVVEKPSGTPTMLEFEGDLTQANSLVIHRLDLVVPPLRLPVKGKIAIGEKVSIDASLATGTVSLSALPEWLAKGGFEAGNFEASLDIKGTGRDWKTWRTTGWVALTNGLMLAKGIDGHVNDVFLRMKLVRNGAELKRLSFRVNDSDVNMNGTIKNWTTKPVVAAKIESSHMDIDLLIPKGDRSPLREFLETLAATSRVSAVATIERGIYKQIRLGGLNCRLTIQDGVLDIDRISGQSDTGQLAGRVVVQLPRQAPAETEASIRLTGIPMDEVLPLLGSKNQWVAGDLRLSVPSRPWEVGPPCSFKKAACSRMRNGRSGRSSAS